MAVGKNMHSMKKENMGSNSFNIVGKNIKWRKGKVLWLTMHVNIYVAYFLTSN